MISPCAGGGGVFSREGWYLSYLVLLRRFDWQQNSTNKRKAVRDFEAA